mgnify:FL=1
MQADVYNLGTGFYKLQLIRDTELREDVVNYDGADTYLLDCYTLAGDGDYVFSDNLGLVTLVRVGTCAVIGSASGEVRCYTHDITAYRDNVGDLWMDAELHDEVFC